MSESQSGPMEMQAEGVVAELAAGFGFDQAARDEVRQKLLAMKPGDTLAEINFTVTADKNGFHLQTGEEK